MLGVDFSTMSGSDFSETATRTGFMGGLFVTFPVGSSVVIEPEVLYSQKGTKFSGTGYSETLALDYIEIPVLFRYNFKPEGGPYILAGPAVGFNITCKDTYSEDGQSDVKSDCSDFDVTANTTFGGIVGLGFSKGHIGLEARYDFDFGNALKVDVVDTDIEAKNGVWAILVRLTK